MEIVPLDKIPDAKDVPTDDLVAIYKVATQMERLCTELNGVGLAAPQVGIPWKLFIIKDGRTYKYFVNCDYEGSGTKEKSIEGCLSLRNSDGQLRRFELMRYPEVKVKGKRLRFTEKPSLVLDDVDIMERGLKGCIFQHEIDHLRQITIDQIGKEIQLLGS